MMILQTPFICSGYTFFYFINNTIYRKSFYKLAGFCLFKALREMHAQGFKFGFLICHVYGFTTLNLLALLLANKFGWYIASA